MDVRCPFCGEPWDQDSLHDMPASTPYHGDYARASADFRRYGCGFFDHAWNGRPLAKCRHRVHDAEAAEKASLAYATLGDDLDGAASLLNE